MLASVARFLAYLFRGSLRGCVVNPPQREKFRDLKFGFAIVGGNYDNGALDGLFCLNVNNAVSNSNANIGGSLS